MSATTLLTIPTHCTGARSRVLGAMLALLTLALTAGAATAAGGGAVHVSGHTQFNPELNIYLGDAEFVFDSGATQHALVTTYPMSQPVTLPNGMLISHTSHLFDFGDGDTITTIDLHLLFPTSTPGLYELHSSMVITSGTGSFDGAVGHLISLDGSTANLFTGEIMPIAGGHIVMP